MSPAEFNEQYSKLAFQYPKHFGQQAMCDAVTAAASGLSVEWFAKVVNLVLTGGPIKINILDEIKAEKRRLAQEFSTSEQSNDFEEMKRNSTGFGLEAMKKKYGASSAWELVEKTKRKA